MLPKKGDGSLGGNRSGNQALEDALRALHQLEYAGQAGADLVQLAGALDAPRETVAPLVEALVLSGLVQASATGELRLTEEGNRVAVHLVRAHRLLETLAAREGGTPPGQWHARAHRDEHRLTHAAANALADQLGNPRYDPHGDPIPTREGTLPPREGVLLGQWQGDNAVLQHIEDEPPALFERLHAAGFHPGQAVRVQPLAGGSVELLAAGRHAVLTAPEAALVHVSALPDAATPELGYRPLQDLRDGEAATVGLLSPACVGAERTRLLDLGFVPGSHVQRVFASPLGSPVVYRVRGTQIALRREQARQIFVAPVSTSAAA